MYEVIAIKMMTAKSDKCCCTENVSISFVMIVMILGIGKEGKWKEDHSTVVRGTLPPKAPKYASPPQIERVTSLQSLVTKKGTKNAFYHDEFLVCVVPSVKTNHALVGVVIITTTVNISSF